MKIGRFFGMALGITAALGFGFMALAAAPAFATTQTCGILTGGSSGGEAVDAGYTARLLGQANEGCNVLITFQANGSIVTTNPNNNGFYDVGGDDNEIGIVNNTSSPINSLLLSSASQTIFGFDGDGVCGGYTFSPLGPNCGSATTGYLPTGVTATGIALNDMSGTVNFAGGIASGAGAFFSLEGPVDVNLTVGPTPEPGTLALLPVGLALLPILRSRKFRK